MDDVTVRPYDPDRDREGLWACKAAFERGLGSGTGDEAKATTYEAKLTEAYRERYLDWVDRCVADDERCVTVAAAEGADATGAGAGLGPDTGAGLGPSAEVDVVGYVFVLPERLSMVWDAAVLNEVWVAPDRRGTGVADALLDAALALARDQDLPLDRLVLDVDDDNERARAFYERHGFTDWGRMVARPL